MFIKLLWFQIILSYFIHLCPFHLWFYLQKWRNKLQTEGPKEIGHFQTMPAQVSYMDKVFW